MKSVPTTRCLRGFAAVRAERLCLSGNVGFDFEATPRRRSLINNMSLVGKAEPYRTEGG